MKLDEKKYKILDYFGKQKAPRTAREICRDVFREEYKKQTNPKKWITQLLCFLFTWGFIEKLIGDSYKINCSGIAYLEMKGNLHA